ncbi:carbon storage regulator CsrA [Aliibacillus thermotolerans]|uniref:Translational regulator CsrA n=1 Tax=Aliibacillus thermotolerans TaxID=1834418 RepID=A0ABW0U8A6_9BACI|nr:carbon storage regulator CsrA [Aliibacillus thermotolerans]MDA3130952.1 carbon storage regulator CsrA [Aliibacillus thermotolerans]
MLVLTRKTSESIQIGEDIEVKILAIDGEQVKIGIDAPKHIDIHRKEVYLNIKEENYQAQETGNMDVLTEIHKHWKNQPK